MEEYLCSGLGLLYGQVWRGFNLFSTTFLLTGKCNDFIIGEHEFRKPHFWKKHWKGHILTHRQKLWHAVKKMGRNFSHKFKKTCMNSTKKSFKTFSLFLTLIFVWFSQHCISYYCQSVVADVMEAIARDMTAVIVNSISAAQRTGPHRWHINFYTDFWNNTSTLR